MFLRLAKQSQFIPLQNVVYFITLLLVRKIFTFYTNDVLLFKCPFPGPSSVITHQSTFNIIFPFTLRSLLKKKKCYEISISQLLHEYKKIKQGES